MSADVLGVGISIRCDEPGFADLGPNLDKAEALGVDYVEIPTLMMPVVADGRVMRDQVRTAKSIIGQRPFGFTVHGPIGVNLMDDDFRMPLHEDVLAASIEVAAELGAVHYVVHTGVVDAMPGTMLEHRYARQREALARAGDIAAGHGLIVVVENAFTYKRSRTTALPSKLAEELRLLDHAHVKACFDFSHGYINSSLYGADFVSEAEALAPFAKHLHIHDSFGRPHDIPTYSKAERLAFGQGDLHLPVGWGSIPWSELFQKLRFCPGTILNIELELAYWGQAASTVATVREFASQMKTTAE